MDLVKQFRKSKVFSNLNDEERQVITVALASGSEETIQEVRDILDQEVNANTLFDASIQNLADSITAFMQRRLEAKNKLLSLKKAEAVDRDRDEILAESQLETLGI